VYLLNKIDVHRDIKNDAIVRTPVQTGHLPYLSSQKHRICFQVWFLRSAILKSQI